MAGMVGLACLSGGIVARSLYFFGFNGRTTLHCFIRLLRRVPAVVVRIIGRTLLPVRSFGRCGLFRLFRLSRMSGVSGMTGLACLAGRFRRHLAGHVEDARLSAGGLRLAQRKRQPPDRRSRRIRAGRMRGRGVRRLVAGGA
ncbi:hypothetical protein PCS_03135 [Desulfocurvibacter africanus PCS]|uniref:Uncharacterized protein n=1 Tax=Desulfocurvibacter africanus PCS TaxID=1262666 RepID=M5PQ15_DESAF|nr:hypothetical protein PCS_03135 [Desulfocurvibacter africanus PCS]